MTAKPLHTPEFSAWFTKQRAALDAVDLAWAAWQERARIDAEICFDKFAAWSDAGGYLDRDAQPVLLAMQEIKRAAAPDSTGTLRSRFQAAPRTVAESADPARAPESAKRQEAQRGNHQLQMEAAQSVPTSTGSRQEYERLLEDSWKRSP